MFLTPPPDPAARMMIPSYFPPQPHYNFPPRPNNRGPRGPRCYQGASQGFRPYPGPEKGCRPYSRPDQGPRPWFPPERHPRQQLHQPRRGIPPPERLRFSCDSYGTVIPKFKTIGEDVVKINRNDEDVTMKDVSSPDTPGENLPFEVTPIQQIPDQQQGPEIQQPSASVLNDLQPPVIYNQTDTISNQLPTIHNQAHTISNLAPDQTPVCRLNHGFTFSLTTASCNSTSTGPSTATSRNPFCLSQPQVYQQSADTSAKPSFISGDAFDVEEKKMPTTQSIALGVLPDYESD